MPSSTKPTLIFVHGAWHDPTCFDLVRKPLEAQGYGCHIPALPATGALAATKTLDDDVETVRSLLIRSLDNSEDVVLVAHSFGGYTACAALEGLVGKANHAQGRGKVLGIAFVAAFIPPFTGKGAFKEVPPMDIDLWVFHETQPTITPRDPAWYFYNDLPGADAEYWTSRIQPFHLPSQDMSVYEAWREIPVSYLVCNKDNGLPKKQQEALVTAVEKEGGVIHVTRIESSHSPFLSMPKTVIEWIEQFVEVDLKK